VVSVRILRAITVPYAHGYLANSALTWPSIRKPDHGAGHRFRHAGAAGRRLRGVRQRRLPVEPYLIAKIVDGDGKVIQEAKPRTTLPDEARARSAQRLRDGQHAARSDAQRHRRRRGRLGRPDLAGKTGTSSDAVDGWFAGYGGGIVAVSWMGYDDSKSLGGKEFGATWRCRSGSTT
jgi:penicillin-binding protein 1A